MIGEVKMRGWVFVSLVLACGTSTPAAIDGGDDASSTTDVQATITALHATPTNPLIDLALGASGSQIFQATATYSDGSSQDVTAQASWSIANAAAGAMSGATLTVPSFATQTALASLVTATYGGLTAQARVTIVAHQTPLVVVPYQDQTAPKLSLSFDTTIKSLDVFFLVDTTGSMSGEIANLKNALSSSVIPGIQTAVTDTQFGVGALEDFPVSPWGSSPCSSGDGTADQPFKLKQTITSTTTLIQTGANGLALSNGTPIGCGNDTPEAAIEALYQVATGEGLSSPSPTNVPANHTGIGGVGFRAGAMPIIVDVSDAVTHGLNETVSCMSTSVAYTGTVATVAHSRANAKTALAAMCGRVVGISAQTSLNDPCSGQAYMEDFTTATGARVPPSAWDAGTRPVGCSSAQCCTGTNGVGRATDTDGLCPLTFLVSTSGTGVSASITTGVTFLSRFAAFDVTTSRSGDQLPNAHTGADFITAVTPTSFQLPPQPPTLPTPTFDATAFHDVTPATQVSFDVTFANSFLAQTNDPQLVQANVQIASNACLPLAQRPVLILVPPTPL